MSHDIDMVAVARRVLQENGFEPDFPPGIEASIPATPAPEPAKDLRDLPWSSIDNSDSMDLDQIEYAERLPDGSIRVLVGIADVDALAPKGSLVDQHAYANTCTLYTGVHIFPMLPEVLSTNRTSLLEDGTPRLAVITEYVVKSDGTLDESKTAVYVATVLNKAKLAYESVGAWLDGHGDAPHGGAVIADQLKLQDEAASRLRELRHEHGALDFETIEAQPVMKDGQIVDLQVLAKNRARNLIEDLMIAANGATARYLETRGRSSIRRVVPKPKRWDRIVELAATFGTQLPQEASSVALSQFLADRRKADPTHFADLSLSIVKLIGPGEYVLQRANDPDTGHFGLAVTDYAHSTAPNRRYPDLVTQRLLKTCAAGKPAAYSDDELAQIAQHCTERENGARKVERTMRKVAAARLLSDHIGETFDAIVTGVGEHGTFVRLLRPPAEGRVVRGEAGMDVGDKVHVKLVDTAPERGFIDFVRV
ncbi:MAG: RNB domain-containing ribonuclease [Deltaproteobacteria bacterium]|nr:RNB domain-containing ribonuclease [Deltaproteobacteria bacterium]